MVKLKLFCAIVGVAGDAFSVEADEGETVDVFKKAILKRKKKKLLHCEDPDDLQLFLTRKKDGAWLPSNDPDAVAMRSGAVPEKMQNLLNGQIDPAGEIADIFVPAPRKEEIHVLVVLPRVESTRPVSAEVQWKNLLNALEWREPIQLCGSDGCDWPYQGAEELGATLADPLVQHYNAWKDGIEDKQTHALNLVLSGPGTGKSRMLDEMKNLLCDAAARSKDQDLIERMESAYVFRVTFENGTAALGSLLDEKNPEFDVSCRMLYQLAKDRKDWPTFVFELKQSYTKLPLSIGMVIDILATLKKVDNVKDMTVILCVDGLQQLTIDGTKKCDFYRVLTAICSFLNSSRAFAVCVCSATVQTPVDLTLPGSPQKRV